jgi:hypothetical protein
MVCANNYVERQFQENLNTAYEKVKTAFSKLGLNIESPNHTQQGILTVGETLYN